MIPRVGFRSVPLQMKEKKGFGSTVLGWFVVKDEPSRPESTEDLIAKYANEQGAELPPELTLPGNLPTAVHGKIDFAGVFKAAGIDQTAQSRVDQAANLLKTLPTEATREVKKQIVEASLKAFGFPIDRIIEAGAQEIQALEVCIRTGQKSTQEALAQSQNRLEQLNAEIAKVKKEMADQATAQGTLTQNCNQYKLKVQEVLEFFGQEAVARVVRESPKLHEPK